MRNKKLILATVPLCFMLASVNATAGAAVSVGDVSVVGQKASRSNTTLTKQGIANITPGTSPVQMLNKLVGVNTTSGGSLGLYEYASQINIRGFDKNQIGQVLDGIPLGGGLTAGGAPVNRFVDSENLTKINVSQGSADISSPSNSALGGTIAYTTGAPANKVGLKLAQTTGSFNLKRNFIRLDSGLVGNTKTYISFSDTNYDKWRSKGNLVRQHAEFKSVSMFGDTALELKATYNDRSDHDYLDVTQTAYNKYGRYYGLQTNWTGNSSIDQNNYQGWTNGRTDSLYSIKLDTMLTDSVKLKVLPYYHHQKGWGRWNPPFILAINPVTGVATTPTIKPTTAMSFRESTYKTDRYGLTVDTEIELGFNTVKAGVWLEKGTRKNGRNWYKTINSASSYMPDRSALYYNQFDYTFKTTSVVAYLQDSITLMDDKLKIDLGVKTKNIRVKFNGLTNNRLAANSLSMTSRKNFLPKVGVTYQVSDSGQAFTSYSENFSQLPDSIFTQATFNPSLKPEQSTNIDVGYRYDDGSTSATVSYYNINYKNKLETLTVAAGNRFFGNTTQLSNVGGVTSQGVELSAGQKLGDFFNLYGTTTLNSSKYKQDIQALKIKGNQVIGQPKVMATAELSYNNAGYSAGITSKYVGKRFATRDNTEFVKPYTTADLHLGYNTKKSFSFLENLTISANVNNVFDKSYLATIQGANTGINNGGGSTYFVGTPRNFSLMLSATM